MSKSRRKPAGSTASAKPAVQAPVRKGPKRSWIVAGAVVLGVLAIVRLSTGSGSGGAGGAGGESSWGRAAVDPQEAKYTGRLLPAGYAEPKVAEAFVYSTSTPNGQAQVRDDGADVSLAVSDVVSQKNVLFEYTKPGGRALPVIAYVKPSGKLFVAVSFCPPCEGERQRIEPDSTLTCESCGTKRDLESGTGLSGACKLYPLDELPVKIAGDRIVVSKALLDGWTSQPKDRPVG